MRENLFFADATQPTPAQLVTMQGLVRQAMEQGALGVTTALIYTPNTFAKTPELVALAKQSGACGGISCRRCGGRSVWSSRTSSSCPA